MRGAEKAGLVEVEIPDNCGKSAADALTELDDTLPGSHVDVLLRGDGLVGYHGYFRLFGLFGTSMFSLREWNDEATWKFAWGSRSSQYFCFAETAWGDQYAYKRSELGSTSAPRVYFLESLGLKEEVLADSFELFLANEFSRNSTSPYDVLTIRAFERFGRLGARESLAFSPSLLLGAEETVDNVVKLPSNVVMVFNGDLATQLLEGIDQRPVVGIEPWTDARGRSRLKVLR